MQSVKRHFLSISDRKNFFFEGAKDLESFDDKSIVVITDKGILTIKGSELHIKTINLEEEKLEVTGNISSIAYNDSKGKSHGKSAESFLKKILK
jgi:sporulation protein YabP